MSKNSNYGAFSCASETWHQPGLTKREYFAAAAMQAIAGQELACGADDEAIANQCVDMADALLEALKEEAPPERGN